MKLLTLITFTLLIPSLTAAQEKSELAASFEQILKSDDSEQNPRR